MSIIDHLAAAVALHLVGAAVEDLAGRLRAAEERAFESSVLATIEAL